MKTELTDPSCDSSERHVAGVGSALTCVTPIDAPPSPEALCRQHMILAGEAAQLRPLQPEPMQIARNVRLLSALVILSAVSMMANTAPVIDSFVASPAVPAPGQAVTLTIAAHDPDCAVPPCTSGCGLTIRSDLVVWSDNTGRTNVFTGSAPSPTGSPWTAAVDWIAPAEGTYRVTVQISDSGGMLCGGRQSTIGNLDISVSNSRPPVIDSMTAAPSSVPVGGQVALTVTAHDDRGRALSYSFSADAGTIVQPSPSSATATWIAPQVAGNFTIRCAVAAAGGASVSTQANVAVQIGTYLRTIAIPASRLTRVAGLPDGQIAAVDGTAGALILTAPSGQISWRKGGLQVPVGVTYAGGEIFVLERGASRVSVFSTSGSKIRDLAITAVMPNGIAAGPNAGELSITDTSSALVDVVSSLDGHALRSVGNGTLRSPSAVATANGSTAVADPALARILVFDAAGNVTGTYGDDVLLVRPQGLAWDGSGHRFVVADSFSAELSIIGEEGVVRGSLAGFGSSPGQLVNPIDVALVPGGLIAVTTAGGNLSVYQLLNTLGPLAPPASVQAGDRIGDDGGAIAISWTRSKDDPGRVVGYRVERSQTGGPFVSIGRVDAGIATFIDATTADGVCYTYHVIATDGASEAVSTDTSCAVSRNDLPPPPPAAAAAEATSPFAIRVSWAAVTAADLAGYTIEVSTGGSVLKNVSAGAGIVAAAIDGLTADNPYEFAVRAFDTAHNVSQPRAASAATYPDIAPPVPTDVTATDTVTGGTVRVGWTSASSRVPVTKYSIAAKPATAGWPSVAIETSASPALLDALVNRLGYAITVTSFTPWGRASDPSAPVSVTPTAPIRDLPIVGTLGWDGTTGMRDTAGLTANVNLEGESRELRLQYRTANAQLQIVIDGAFAGSPLPDTAGAWQDATMTIELDEKNATAPHRVELRNTRFPDPAAQLAIRKMDLVPLEPKKLEIESLNTVIDLVWLPRSSRKDLVAELMRTTIDKKGTPASVSCPHPEMGRCRDPFRENIDNFAYTLTLVSPAGWRSGSIGANGHAKYDELPPPVTDLFIEAAKDPAAAHSWRLSWTPISTAVGQHSSPVAITLYRVYRVENGTATAIAEAAAPPLLLPLTSYDPAKQRLVVRSVDSQGKESR